MKELPTLQEAIEAKARGKLQRDIIDFYISIEELCKSKSAFKLIADIAKFPYENNGEDTTTIQYLFRKNAIKERIMEELLPVYMEREIRETVLAIDKLIKKSDNSQSSQ